MKIRLLCLVVCISLLYPIQGFCSEEPDPHSWTGNANLFLGAKILEKENWEPVDKPMEVGLLLDFKQQGWFASIAVDILYAWANDEVAIRDLGLGSYDTQIESRIIEFDLGVRKIWEARNQIRPFVGGGFAIINGKIEAKALGESEAEEGTGFGIWINTGVYITLSEHFNIGIDTRWSKAQVDLFDREARVGGWHFGARLGYHW